MRGTGVAFAPTSSGVAFAPTQGGGGGECDPRVGANVTPAFVWQAQRFQSLERIFSIFTCYVVTSMSSSSKTLEVSL